MVTTFYPPYHFGGDGVLVYRLSEALAERGHSVDVIHSVDAYRLQHHKEPEKNFSHHPNVTRHELKTVLPKLSALTAHQLGRPAIYARKLRRLLAATGSPQAIASITGNPKPSLNEGSTSIVARL